MNRRSFLSAVAALAAGAVVNIDLAVGESMSAVTLLDNGQPIWSGSPEDLLAYLRAEEIKSYEKMLVDQMRYLWGTGPTWKYLAPAS